MDEWQPIETAPEHGTFLVYMPEAEPKIQTAVWHPNIKVIGNHFMFDMWQPTHWMPLPDAPPAPIEPEPERDTRTIDMFSQQAS